MKTLLKYLSIAAAVLLVTRCSERELSVDPRLGEPLYHIGDGEPGSLDAIVREFNQRYGSFVIYDFAERDIRWTWTGHWYSWYTPMKAGNEAYAARLLTFLKENLYERFTDEFVRKNLSYKIFVVDSVCSSVSFSSSSLINVAERQNGMVLGNAGPQIDGFTDAKWNEIRGDAETIFINGLYNSAPSKPSQFISLRDQNLLIPGNTATLDPLGEYPSQRYRCYMAGWIKGMMPRPTSAESYLKPEEPQDFANYVLFLIQTPATEVGHVMERFPRVRERVLAIVPFLADVLGMDVIATQNINNPDDPMSKDFFQRF
jgi:hypothetical protein